MDNGHYITEYNYQKGRKNFDAIYSVLKKHTSKEKDKRLIVAKIQEILSDEYDIDIHCTTIIKHLRKMRYEQLAIHKIIRPMGSARNRRILTLWCLWR